MLLRRPMRVGRPGLLGTVARTAAVAGTATAVVGGMTRRQQGKQQQAAEAAAYEQQQQAAAMQAAATQAVAAQAAPAAAGDAVAELERLAALNAQGALTDEEFAAAKSKLLAI